MNIGAVTVFPDAAMAADDSIDVGLGETSASGDVGTSGVGDALTETAEADSAGAAEGAGAAAGGPPETVVIGEDMAGRVIPTAQARGATVYSPPEGALPEEWMQNNKDWINQKMDQGCTILDCGAAPGRPNYPAPSSPYYQMELGSKPNKFVAG